MAKKTKAPIAIKLPPKLDNPTSWVVVGFDLSLSRSGWSVMHVQATEGKTSAEFLAIGSIKPADASEPVWARGRALGKGLLQSVFTPKVQDLLESGSGLILSFEAFTPRNDFLSSVRRLVDSVLFSSESPLVKYPIHLLSINASTLRSVMGLVQRGAKNKKENILKAFEFLDKKEFPEIDTDSCDATLLAIMGRYTVSLLMGFPDEVPSRALVSLCDDKQEAKGKGRNLRVVTKGILHRKEYWSVLSYTGTSTLGFKDARKSTKSLEHVILNV